MSMLVDIQTLIIARLEPLLTTATPAGPIKQIIPNAFSSETDVQTLMERFKTVAPAIYLSVPRIQFQSNGQPPNIGGTTQICRVDSQLFYSLAVVTDAVGANLDSSATLGGNLFGEINFHADILDRLLVTLAGYQWLPSQYPSGKALNFNRFESWNFSEGPDIQVSFLTFSLQAFGFGGPAT